jgi:pimeloyl-ACP methyl ester carboxylesterase
MRAMREPWEHRSVETNGLRLHCVTAGEGPLVVLLHGFPEFWYSWRHQIPALARAGFRVVAPDLRGYNESDKPEGVEAYRITSVVDDVAGLVRAFGAERAAIVGHDWGGAAAYAFAMLRPELTDRLAVLNCPHPAPFSRALNDGDLEQLRKSWYMFFFQLLDAPEALLSAHDFRFLRVFAYANARKGTFTPRDLKRFVEAFSKPGALTAAVNWYRAMFRHGLPPAREYPKIAAPALVIWGTRDHFLGTGLTRGMRRYFAGPFTLRYLPGVSHWVQQEAPARVNALLLRFLRERAAGRGLKAR